MKIGLNLFSLRKQIANGEAYRETLCRLADMGYDFVQFSGAVLSPEEIAAGSENAGLPVVLTHVPWQRIREEADALIAEHRVFGCRDIGLGAPPKEIYGSEDSALAFIGEIARRAEVFREKGARLCYHNHNAEFMKFGGRRFFDMLTEGAPALSFIPDTYWLQMGGVSIFEYFERLSGRMPFVHLKDFKLDYMTPRFAALGDGNLDIPAIADKARACGAETFLVEQDDACDYPDPFEEVRKSAAFIKSL